MRYQKPIKTYRNGGMSTERATKENYDPSQITDRYDVNNLLERIAELEHELSD